MAEADELTVSKLRAAMAALKPVPPMPRWKDLTWPQRNMVEREIDATRSVIVRDAIRAAYYCADDDCPYHGEGKGAP